jgi:hypothetical protein
VIQPGRVQIVIQQPKVAVEDPAPQDADDRHRDRERDRATVRPISRPRSGWLNNTAISSPPATSGASGENHGNFHSAPGSRSAGAGDILHRSRHAAAGGRVFNNKLPPHSQIHKVLEQVTLIAQSRA